MLEIIFLELKFSSGSSGRVRGGEKHEIYVAAFGGHLFYDLFSQGWGGAWPPRPPLGSATEVSCWVGRSLLSFVRSVNDLTGV